MITQLLPQCVAENLRVLKICATKSCGMAMDVRESKVKWPHVADKLVSCRCLLFMIKCPFTAKTMTLEG